MNTKSAAFTVIAALIVFSVGLFGNAYAARRVCSDGTYPPCDDSGEPPDLGDIIVLYRDADGLPILTGDLCQQPLAAPGVSLEPSETYPGCVPASETESCVIPVNPVTCAVAPGYEAFVQEVDFGRTSVIRSPVSVIEASLAEVVTKLATAQCTTLDPAGRPVNTSEIDGEVLSATIDSPLENLAIYRQLMLTGYLGTEANPILLPGANVLTSAARGFGAAADKAGKVTKDQLIYSNEIMGLTNENLQTYLPKKCLNVREEVEGSVQTVRKCFLDYGPTGGNYSYIRADNFGALPAPSYIPADDPLDGWFEYLALYPDATPDGDSLFQILQGPIMDNVFGTDLGFLEGNIGGFVQAADDTREVIEFTHDRPLPLGYETQVPLCDVPDTDLIYDLSLSEESGLQVPTRMVDGSEGREFTVTVVNAGPDAASGIVMVTAVEANGTPIEGSPWPLEFTDLGGDSSESWTTLFSINLGYSTTITWKATAIPDCTTCDLNPNNNTVTATTMVKLTESGGGQGGQGRR